MRWIILTLPLYIMLVACEAGVDFVEGASALPEGAFTDHLEPTPYQPPIVRIVSEPGDLIEGDNASATFEIINGEAPISQVICLVDGVQVGCDANGDTISVETPAVGGHTITIIAEDENGIRDEGQIDYEVFKDYVPQVQNIAVNAQDKTKSDILFVIDNSGSMAEEQANMADRIVSFMERLSGLDWRIAISTTDPNNNNSYGDGQIVPFMNGSYYLESSLGIDAARTQFADAVQREETGSGYERGIYSAYRSVERAMDGNGTVNAALASFFRPEASLSIVLVSDEDETTLAVDGSSLPSIEKSDGQNLMALVRSTWGQEKVFQFNSIITRPGDTQCLQPNGNGYTYGTDYEELSRATNGIVGDICAADYGSQLTSIGQGVADLQTVYNLNCVPQDANGDGSPDFSVTASGGQSVPSHTIQGAKVTFSQALAPGDYQFAYFCF